jgi:hypothetical protein
MTDALIDEKLKVFYEIQQLIKTLETLNKQHRSDLSDMVCVDQYKRRTSESQQDGWEYLGPTHSCTIRPYIRHYIDKEQLPRDVYQMYGKLQEVITISVAKNDGDDDDDAGDVHVDVDGCRCTYTPKRTRPKGTSASRGMTPG